MAWFRRSTIRPVIGRPHYRFSTTRPVRVVIWWCGSVGRPHDRLKVDHITSSEPNDWFVWLYGRVVPYICSSLYSYGPLITCGLFHDFNPQQTLIRICFPFYCSLSPNFWSGFPWNCLFIDAAVLNGIFCSVHDLSLIKTQNCFHFKNLKIRLNQYQYF